MGNEDRPLRVWLTVHRLDKATGGPAVVIQNLGDHLAALGAAVTIAVAAGANGQPEALPEDKRVRVVRLRQMASVAGGKAALLQQCKAAGADVLHDFGIWLPNNHNAARTARALRLPFVVSPSGMLSPWALKYKAWKKRIAWWLYQRRDLASAKLFVACARPEAEHIQNLFPGKPVALVPNGVKMPSSSFQQPAASRKLQDTGSVFARSRSSPVALSSRLRTVLYLGRIHPTKGLVNLVEAWARVRPAGWRCVLAGPDELGHRGQLETALRQRGIVNDFNFAGMVDGNEKWLLLKEADLFVLPSFTENFGIVVIEALAAGVPVITTKGTPWQELPERRCGWWLDATPAALAQALKDALHLTDAERRQMGQRGRQFVEQNYSWPSIAASLLEGYYWASGTRPKPIALI